MTNDESEKAANAASIYLESLEQILAPDQVLSDTLFLRVNRRGLGVGRRLIEIDHMQYQILDPLSLKKWHYGFNEADVIVFVVSLTSYYEFSDGDTQTVRTLTLVDKGRMTDFRIYRTT